jgi:hypothetical protein
MTASPKSPGICNCYTCSAISCANKIVQASPENIDASLGSRFTRVPSLDNTAAATAESSLERRYISVRNRQTPPASHWVSI